MTIPSFHNTQDRSDTEPSAFLPAPNWGQITEWCRHFICMQVQTGALCIDATMGNGNDTLLLSRLAGDCGQVLAFDIQKEALFRTETLLKEKQAPKNWTLHLDSHANMAQYASPDTIDCIVFNFGYLPGGSHQLATRADTSVQAVKAGLTLLKKGGLMSLCIYSGKDTGFAERDSLLSLVQALDYRHYLVIQSAYCNRPNHPPIPVLIWKR